MRYAGPMARYVGAAEAARQLGVQRATLYAYVSRGLIGRRVAVDGRTSLYSVDDLEHLARRVRRRDAEVVPRPSLDVQIVTTVTTLDEDGVRYRGHDVAELARTSSFERVAELLWTGTLPDEVAWPRPDPADRSLAQRRRPRRRRTAAPGNGGRRQRTRCPPCRATTRATAARRLLGVAPTVLGEPDDAATGLAGRAPGGVLEAGRGPRRWRRSSTGRSSCSPTTSWPRARSRSGSPARRGRRRTRRSPPGWPWSKARSTAPPPTSPTSCSSSASERGAATGRRRTAAGARAPTRLRPQDLQGRRPPPGPVAGGHRPPARPARPRRRPRPT